MDRREFLGVGASTAALTMAGPVSAMIGRRMNALVVYDSRFDEGRRFAEAAAREHGLRAICFAGDASALWHGQLLEALSGGTTVIGLTAGGARFCLQLLAGPGMRFVHHITHAPMTLQHVCWTGDKGADQEMRCAPAWPEQAARIAMRQSVQATGATSRPSVSRAYPAHRLPAADHLESWVLAPAPAALRGNGPFADWKS